MTIRDDVRSLIQLHEGLRLRPYTDTAGKLTIGYGRNLTDRGISAVEAECLFQTDLTAVISLAHRWPWWEALDPVRQAVVLDMLYNLGPVKFAKFRRTLTAMQAHDPSAADHMLASRWAKQVGARAQRLARMWRTGRWPVEMVRREAE